MAEELTMRERVLRTSLRLFATKGFDVVTPQEICDEAGIRKVDLYGQFDNRQEIFKAIMEDLKANYDIGFQKANFHPEDPELDVERFIAMSEDEMIKLVQSFFQNLVHDPFLSLSRKLLTVEQFRTPEVKHFYNEHYVFELINYMAGVFEVMVNLQLIEDYSPHVMAMEFMAPLEILLTVVDRDPDAEVECLKAIDTHVRQFRKVYNTFYNEDEEYSEYEDYM